MHEERQFLDDTLSAVDEERLKEGWRRDGDKE